jgi:cytosine/adenosine deaminase-related metal-dependent hydrolase
MKSVIAGVVLLPTDGAPAAPPVDIAVVDGRIFSISPAAAPARKKRLAMPALVNAHDHCRPLSPTSFGGANKPLESWLLRLGAMPAVDPYVAALCAFGRAARGGAGSVMAHYTRFHGPMSPVDEVLAVAHAAAEVGVRVTFAVFMRDKNPLVYGDSNKLLASLPPFSRAPVESKFLQPMPSVEEQIVRAEKIAAAVESEAFCVQFGPSGPQWCSDELLRAIAERSRATGRRVHMHLLETQYQRAYLDRIYPEGVVKRLTALGLMSERLTLAHCVYARPDELDAIAAAGAVIATNPSSNLHLRSGVAPIGEAIQRGCRVGLGVDASAFDEDDDILREMRLGHFLHAGWGFASVVSREKWLKSIVGDGRFANGAPGDGALVVGAPADILVLDLEELDRDAVTPTEPIDFLFARAHAIHVDRLVVAGRDVVSDGRLAGADLDAAHEALRREYRAKMPAQAPFLAAWSDLEPAVAGFYNDLLGCC